ncbi:MAG: MBL fold metallo-hydrolase [Gemmatimonadota bacterium]|nr:MAG: MBL fold metallo-hydrolase [Gemmatimonadota bacterium]
MNIVPLACESLGTRGMAAYVSTGDLGILIDPGVDLAPVRFRLPPHRLEIERKAQHWNRIRAYAQKARILIVTHYHHDHFHEDEFELFRDKHVLLKHPEKQINFNQKKRAKALLSRIENISREIHYVDGRHFTFGDVRITFSRAVCHGINDRSGYVVEVSIRNETTFLHTSDVTGPIRPEQLEFILKQDPEILLCDGPVSYMVGSKYDTRYLDDCMKNLITIIERTRVHKLMLEHHLLRELEWQDRIAPVFDAAKERGVILSTAAEFGGLKTDLLEARRKELHARSG